MSTPLHLKPPIAAWIARERRRMGLKPRDVAARLTLMGLDVTEATVKVWESNADRRPNPYNLDGLERIFDSKAPQPAPEPSTDITELAASIRDLAKAIEAERAEREAWERGVLESVQALARALARRDGPEPAPLAGGR